MGRKVYRAISNRLKQKNIPQSILDLFVILLFCGHADAIDYTLCWDENPEPDIAGYIVYYKADFSGQPDGDYEVEIDVGDVTYATIEGLDEDRTYFFAVTAYDTSDLESDFSNEVSNDDYDTYSSTNNIQSADSSGGGGGCYIITTKHSNYFDSYTLMLKIVLVAGVIAIFRFALSLMWKVKIQKE